jgi:hypothetical protein
MKDELMGLEHTWNDAGKARDKFCVLNVINLLAPEFSFKF